MLHPLANGIGGMSLVASIHQQTWETNEIFGSVKFKTLFGKEQLVGNSPIAIGYAALDSSGILDMHTHDDAEFYFVPEVVPTSLSTALRMPSHLVL